MLNRFSSLRSRLKESFLAKRLKNAKSYRRIAGYFRSSIFELVGEEISNIPKVQVVCNSDLDTSDIAVSRHAREVALKERFNRELSPEMEALLSRDRYRRLYELLRQGNVEIRVVPRQRVFLHGKAGILEFKDGTKAAFLGSANETREAFEENYELIWEDESPEGVLWLEEEFEALWQDAYPLPEAIVEEIGRISRRIEVRLGELAPEEVPPASLAESPIYRHGEELQPWQRSFVTIFLRHREIYGKARLLLADEVGVGKTLSLAASAMISCLLGDGPVLILCPATLTWQWQVELKDRLGIPSAVWHSQKKEWIDQNGHIVRTRGPEDIKRAPFQIAIVSTGLIFHGAAEKEALLSRQYGTVILDEAHRARRRGGLGGKDKGPNNLLDFMVKIAPRTRHLLLGTATPIQTQVYELWDLLNILNEGTGFVLGRYGIWKRWQEAVDIVKGERIPEDEQEAWEWLRDPLPPGIEHSLFQTVRLGLGVSERDFMVSKGFGSLDPAIRLALNEALEKTFFRQHNPVLRHTVLRRRRTLEEKGLLPRIGVDIHPRIDADPSQYSGANFQGLGLLTNHPFDLAYRAAEKFTQLLKKRTRAGGFMKTLLLQRICSSFAAGRSTAEKMLERKIFEDEEDFGAIKDAMATLTSEEAAELEIIRTELSRPEAHDPKLGAVMFFLKDFWTEGKTWLEHGCIIFSQYYDTVFWIAESLARAFQGEVVAVYGGSGKSGLFKGQEFGSAAREEIKAAVKAREIRLVVATDAASEGLNLQTLGTLINIDLPWNPSRLEQRLGRIKRIGQVRQNVEMLNLVYKDTQDEKIYEVLSKRMKDRYDIFGSLPDTIDDEWIENVERLEEMMDKYMHLRDKARDEFSIRYEEEIDPDENRWELWEKVVSRRDIEDKLSEPW